MTTIATITRGTRITPGWGTFPLTFRCGQTWAGGGMAPKDIAATGPIAPWHPDTPLRMYARQLLNRTDHRGREFHLVPTETGWDVQI